MPKLRKMLGDVYSPECRALMELLSSQSRQTLARWSISYVKSKCLPIYNKICSNSLPREMIKNCEALLDGKIKLTNYKPIVKEVTELARNEADPAAQAAARAIATAGMAVKTPTNSLGFVFYAAAASAYSQLGTHASAAEYDKVAREEFISAFKTLQAVAIADEPEPSNLDWGC